MAEPLVESLAGDVRAGEVPRRVPRAGARPHQQEGRRRGVRGARGGRREAEGRRPDGGARGQREGGQGRPRTRHPAERPPKATASKSAAKTAAKPQAGRPRRRSRRSGADVGRKRHPHDGAPVDVEIDGRTARAVATSTRCSTRRGFTKAEVIDYYARIAPVAAAAPRRPGADVPPLPQRHRRRRASSRSAARRTGRSGSPSRSGPATARAASSTAASTSRRRWCGPPTWRRSSCTRRWRSPPTSTRRGRWCSTSIPAAHGRHRRLLRRRPRRPRRARRRRPRGLVQDVGLEGPADVRPAEHAGATHEARRRLRPRRRPAARERQLPRRGDDRDGQGRAPRQGVRRLEPERPPQDDDRAVLAARPARADGVDAGDVGRGRGRAPTASSSCASRPPTCSTGSRSSATCSSRC